MARVMYVKPGCPHCERARSDLATAGLSWEERDATREPAFKRELMRYSKGTGMVPTVVVDGQVESVGWKGHG